MNFDFTEDQNALRDLARKVLSDHSTDERLKALKAAGEWNDKRTWDALAQASLLGVAVPEAHGGSGMGLVELGLLCEEIGRAVAQVPVLASLVLGALPIAHFGSAAQQKAWLPGVAAGTTILTAGHRGRARRPRPAAMAAQRRADGSQRREDRRACGSWRRHPRARDDGRPRRRRLPWSIRRRPA
jgi:alkylation response protein AidB-like acyl-CoA dehydrogenase